MASTLPCHTGSSAPGCDCFLGVVWSDICGFRICCHDLLHDVGKLWCLEKKKWSIYGLNFPIFVEKFTD